MIFLSYHFIYDYNNFNKSYIYLSFGYNFIFESNFHPDILQFIEILSSSKAFLQKYVILFTYDFKTE